MYLLTIFLPLFNSFVLGFFGRFLGKKGSAFFSLLCLFLSLFCSAFLFYEVILYNQPCYCLISNWINIGILDLNWEFLFDSLTCTMLLLVFFVSFLVHCYSIDYMSEDPHFSRFFSYLSLFTFFMVILVTSGNIVQLFIGWEGVGLASFLLINFWFTREEANKSALKAVIVNRFGDFFFYLAIIFIFYLFKTFNFFTIFSLSYLFCDLNFIIFGFEFPILNLIALFIFLGAVGKSAQLGLHIWLPDAMEGPTPVSALIHAATMVTAGIFLLIRFSPLIEYSGSLLLFISLLGGFTAFFSATVGLVQYDLKKVIAYSTCSQLGYMTFSCGLSNYSGSLFHLFNHGFFKALLFLGAGSIIHAVINEQDIRKLGGLIKLLPFTYSIFLIGSLSLAGFPFLTGFYSKDFLLEFAFSSYFINNLFIYWLGVLSASLTSFYSFRLLYFIFYLPKSSVSKGNLKLIHDAPLFMLIPLCLLSIGSIFFGYLFKDLFVGLGTDVWFSSIFVKSSHWILLDSEFLPGCIKLIPVFFSFFGIFLCFYFYDLFFFNNLLKLKFDLILTFYKFLSHKWYFDFLYNSFIVKYFLKFCYLVSFKLLDRGFLEFFGNFGLVKVSSRFSLFLSNRFHSGFIYHYIFLIVLGLFFFLFIYIFFNFLFFFQVNFLLIWFLSLIFLVYFG